MDNFQQQLPPNNSHLWEWLITGLKAAGTVIIGGFGFMVTRLHTRIDHKVDKAEYEQHVRNDEIMHKDVKDILNRQHETLTRIDQRVFDLYKNGKNKK